MSHCAICGRLDRADDDGAFTHHVVKLRDIIPETRELLAVSGDTLIVKMCGRCKALNTIETPPNQ